MSYTQDLRNLIAQIRSVLKGDTVEPEDHNLQTDSIKKIADLLDDLDTRLKSIANYKLIASVRGSHSATITGNAYGVNDSWEPHYEDYYINQTPFAHINEVLKPRDILVLEIDTRIQYSIPDVPTAPVGFVSEIEPDFDIYKGTTHFARRWGLISRNEAKLTRGNILSDHSIGYTIIFYIPDDLDYFTYDLYIYLFCALEKPSSGNVVAYCYLWDWVKLFRMI
jgi:hypothetical protein